MIDEELRNVYDTIRVQKQMFVIILNNIARDLREARELNYVLSRNLETLEKMMEDRKGNI